MSGHILFESQLYFEAYYDNDNSSIWKETLGAGRNTPLPTQ